MEVWTALANATARRYRVEASDLYTPSQIAEELTKEVMESSFISSAQKCGYCFSLAKLGTTTSFQAGAEVENSPRTPAAVYWERLATDISMSLGVSTVTTTAMISFLESFRSKGLGTAFLDFEGEKAIRLLLPTVAAMTTMVLSAVALLFYRDLRRRAHEREAVRMVREWIEQVFGVRTRASSPLLEPGEEDPPTEMGQG